MGMKRTQNSQDHLKKKKNQAQNITPADVNTRHKGMNYWHKDRQVPPPKGRAVVENLTYMDSGQLIFNKEEDRVSANGAGSIAHSCAKQ